MKLFLRLIYELKRLITKKPFIAEIDITDKCNLRCSHCYHFAEKGGSAGKDLPLEVWKERLEELYAKGIRMVMLMGGEPMLRSDVVLLANEMFPFVEMITNGTIPLPDKLSYRHRIFVSIDGSESTNDKIRGDGVFVKVFENIKEDKRVVLNMTLMESNYQELEYICELALKLKVSGVVCNIFTAVKSVNESLGTETRKKIIDELFRLKKKYPSTLLFTNSAIKWFETADHRDACYWREGVLHFDTDFKERACFADADCSNCGCFAGAMGSPLGSFRQFFELVELGVRKMGAAR
jgi:MoaA/NifB/PqqE/SkfB family radical SAM enzyme